MPRGKILNKNPQEGDIKIMPSNPSSKWRYTNGKWVYMKKQKGYFKKDQPKPPKKEWVNNFPPVTLPEHIKPTNYPHYYVSNDGIAYREPRQRDEGGRYGEVNEYGLIELNTHLRGNPNYGESKMYLAVNIYFYDENNKNCGYKKRNIHQLVAETWVPNPHGYKEILHLDENNRNNCYTNLKWGTHIENMEGVISPCASPKPYKITDTITGKVWSGINIAEWARQNYDLIIPRMKSSNHKLSDIARILSSARSKGKNGMIWKFKIEHGV